MIGAAGALILIGIILLFILPWVGLIVGVVGVLLAVAFLLGFGKRAAEGQP